MKNTQKIHIMIRKIISIRRLQGLQKMLVIIFKLLMRNLPAAKRVQLKARLMARIHLIKPVVDSWIGQRKLIRN